MKCTRCGSGKTQRMQLLDRWLQRYHCTECGNTFVEQVAAQPPRQVVDPDDARVRRGS